MSLNLAPFCRDMRIQENYENLEGGKGGGGTEYAHGVDYFKMSFLREGVNKKKILGDMSSKP